MTRSAAPTALAEPALAAERRCEPRELVTGMLWMIDHDGATILRCHCVEASGRGMRLRAPLGYGIAEGQRYELCSHLPGRRPMEGFGVVGNRWATVVRTQLRLERDEDHVEIGLVLDAPERSALRVSATAARA